jgi:transcription factor Pcc1
LSSVSLTLTCSGKEEARAIQKVLGPDNEGGPRGFMISVGVQDNVVKFLLRSETPSTAISTVLGILRDVSLFEQVWLLSRRTDGGSTRT